MAIEATGKIFKVFEAKQISDRFTKREFVLSLDDGKYPQTVLFEVTGDRCSDLDEYAIGDEVRIEFNLRGREWRSPQGETKYFNTLNVWKIKRTASVQTAPKPPPTEGGIDEDIPF